MTYARRDSCDHGDAGGRDPEPSLKALRTSYPSQSRIASLAAGHGDNPQDGHEVVFDVKDVTVSYSGRPAIADVNMQIHKNLVTAFIGPSGCGKTTLLRSFNRMNDLIKGATVAGTISYHGHDLNGKNVDAVEVRRRIGMVFQRPNPFPKSIYDNVAYGLSLHGMKDGMNDRVEQALTSPASGTRSKTGSRQAPCRCRAASNNDSVSPGRSRSSPT